MSNYNDKKPVKPKKSSSIRYRVDKFGTIIGKYYSETEARKAIMDIAREIIKDLSEEELSKLGSMSGTLHFVRLLGMASKKDTRTVKKYKFDGDNIGRDIEWFTPVGVELISDIDISVPVIDMHLVKELMRKKRPGEPPTYFDPKGDVGERKVRANEPFYLSLYEFLFLMIRDEYAGMLRRDETDDDWGVNIEFKWTNALEQYSDGSWGLKSMTDEFGTKKFVLPTPYVRYFARGGGGPKVGMIVIDEVDDQGVWRIKDEYKRFEPLLKRRVRADKSADKNKDGKIFEESKKVIKKRSGLGRKKV